jgi:diguanylate cyclase (GGDEF)-like protein
MVVADATDGTDPAPSPPAAIGDLRRRVLWGMALFFVGVMALVTLLVSTSVAGSGPALTIRLLLLAVALPVAMSVLVRQIVGPATALETLAAQLRELYSQARIDALLDPITGLGNHRAFQEELHRQIEDASRHGHSLALVLIDLDDLKRVNDEHGHVGGDHLLSTTGRLLLSASRAADRSFRIGGDEFALLLPRADAAAAHGVVRRVLADALSGDSRTGRAFSFSAGVASYPEPSPDGRRLLRNADAALYWAKRHGRTDVQVYDPDRHGDSEETRSAAELAEAVDHVATTRALVPLFQPIFDLSTGRPVGFEGMVRPTEEAGFRNASALFTAAELADRTVELDMAAITAIVAGLDEEVEGAYLSVNMSPRSLETDQFRVSDLVAALEDSPFAPDQVVLELTERETVDDMERLRTNLEACQAAGFRIAADDVGAGNAGLRLLSEIRFDVVKIDLSLVQGGVLRDSALAVLRAIQDLAARSNATVVAEGIETAEQLDVVRSLGIRSGQGYLLAAPGPRVQGDAIAIDGLIASHRARREALLSGPDVAIAS